MLTDKTKEVKAIRTVVTEKIIVARVEDWLRKLLSLLQVVFYYLLES